ncbi:uncharacterized protein LOC130808351 [Amaranthus tricolor]|uniref:uncharacterized protein LOC130808351 n=1 Tax=Amaranthus tricolor TaxID=29722 RepID=UPI00258F5286|nr:uncharacterized protein LOC130808351 [Amaranthus tricolor]
MMGTYNNYCTHSLLREENVGERFAFKCNGCREFGYGSRYTCQPQCDYHLHTSCHNAPPTMSHPFFNQAQFVLDKSVLPPTNYHYYQGMLPNLCVACGTSVEGWRYVLTINGSYPIFLHPCCMALPHPTLHTRLESIDCVHCRYKTMVNEEVKGWAYVKLGVAVHVKCMKEMLHEAWMKRYNNSPQNVHANYYNYCDGTQERGLANGGGVPGQRTRKRDYLLYGLDLLAQVCSIFNSLGLIHLDSTQVNEALVEFASYIWGN